MKLMYGNVPVKSMKIKHYEMNTNDATLKSSDLQSGITAYAKGKKVTGTGKSFEFAYYGVLSTNRPRYIPSNINVIEIASTQYPIQLFMQLSDMKNNDFSTLKTIANVTVDSVVYPINVQAANNVLTISCDKTLDLELFYGKDNYI